MRLKTIKEILRGYETLKNHPEPRNALLTIGRANVMQIVDAVGYFYRLQNDIQELCENGNMHDDFPLFATWRDESYFLHNTPICLISYEESADQIRSLKFTEAHVLHNLGHKVLVYCDRPNAKERVLSIDITSPFIMTGTEAEYFDTHPQDFVLWLRHARILRFEDRAHYLLEVCRSRAEIGTLYHLYKNYRKEGE